MLRDVHREHPSDPLLVQAWQKSAEAMLLGQQAHAMLMRAATERLGPQPEGKIISFSNDEVEVKQPYMNPASIELIGQFLKDMREPIARQLTEATTLEAQRDVLLHTMRAMLVVATFDHIHPRQAGLVIDTVTQLFDQYHLHDEAISRPMLDARNEVLFYAQIAHDSLLGINGLLQQKQLRDGVTIETIAQTPYGLAYQRYMDTHKIRTAGEEIDTDAIKRETREIFHEILGPYLEVLPQSLGVEVVGLTLRTAQQVADDAMHTGHVRLGGRISANDNAPSDAGSVMMNPLVRRRAYPILRTLFAQHPNAAESPEATLEAAQTLEILLGDAKRAGQIISL